MKFIVSIILCFLSADCHSQDGWVNIKYGITKRAPMIEAVVTSQEYQGTQIIDYFPALKIKSKYDSVFSCVDGFVKAIDSTNGKDSILIMIDNKTDKFFTLEPFKKVFCVNGQAIKKGDLLGLAHKKAREFELQMQITDSLVRFVDAKEMWQILNERQ